MRGYQRCLMIAAMVLGWSSASVAAEVFGIQLRRPLNMAECLMRQDAYLSDDHEQCFQWPDGVTHSDGLPRDGQIIVNVPLEDRPSYMSGTDVVVGLKDGLVVSVSAKTHGTVGGGDDLYWLTEAFGKPQQDPGQSMTPWSLSNGITIYYNDNEWGPYFGLVRMQSPDASPHQVGVWD
jgi:hypothetical protein